jgi:epoxyqueuosine reductase
VSTSLKQLILQEARRLGFVLAGVTRPEPPAHLSTFEAWLRAGRHGAMAYLATERARERRADPRIILPECKSIIVLATPYDAPASPAGMEETEARGRIASYAHGDDYHDILPTRMQALVHFIETQVGHAVGNRWYTDAGPILERDLAQRAGLGWIGKNTCLINPRRGSYFLLSEILLDLELEPDAPFEADRCGSCTRCIEACPTECILPDRTIDARRCISYLTIELKDEIPDDLRTQLGNWVFGCDICQEVCPWNRFAAAEGDPAFRSGEESHQLQLIRELEILPAEFNKRFRSSPVRRSKRRGYLRNVATALGNVGGPEDLPALEKALSDAEPLVRAHAAWAIGRIQRRSHGKS